MAGALKFWNGEEDIIIGGSGGSFLPVATIDTLGGVKSGGDMIIDADGLISVADGVIGTSNIATKAVSRVKLADDVLYSPVINTGTASEYYFETSDLGKTVSCISTAPSQKITYIMSSEVAEALPLGAEIAIAWTNGSHGVEIKFEGEIKSAMTGDGAFVAGRTYNIPERYSMVALKLMGNSSPTYWLVTGNVEVVS